MSSAGLESGCLVAWDLREESTMHGAFLLHLQLFLPTTSFCFFTGTMTFEASKTTILLQNPTFTTDSILEDNHEARVVVEFVLNLKTMPAISIHFLFQSVTPLRKNAVRTESKANEEESKEEPGQGKGATSPGYVCLL